LRQQAGFRQTSVGDPKRSGVHGRRNPTCTSKLALAKPSGCSQKTRDTHLLSPESQLSLSPLGVPKGPGGTWGVRSYSRQQAGLSQTFWAFPEDQECPPTLARELAFTKPLGCSQRARRYMGGGILLAPASWLSPSLLGVPKRSGVKRDNEKKHDLLTPISWLSPIPLGKPKSPEVEKKRVKHTHLCFPGPAGPPR
jgi:hypothetical protein